MLDHLIGSDNKQQGPMLSHIAANFAMQHRLKSLKLAACKALHSSTQQSLNSVRESRHVINDTFVVRHGAAGMRHPVPGLHTAMGGAGALRLL